MSSQFKFNPFTHKLDYTGTAAGPGNIVTINGDTGSITGNVVTIYANQATKNCGSSVSFDNSGTVSTMSVTDSIQNTIIGQSSGNATTTGVGNTSLGFSNFFQIDTGAQNTAIGYAVLNGVLTGSRNVGIGASPLNVVTSGSDNIGIGFQAGLNLLTGSNNVLIGGSTGALLTSGSNNTIIGNAGSAYTSSESNNILLGHDGILGESNAIHIGQQGGGIAEQNSCYIAGIAGVSVTNTQMVTINSSTGQLGSTSLPPTPFAWSVIGASQTLAVGNGYLCTSGGALSLALPATSAVGDTIRVVLDGSTSWRITQPNAGTQIRIGSSQTTLGVGGSLASTAAGDSIELVCETANARWAVVSMIGNITVV